MNTREVARRVTSQTLIGRAPEVEALHAALAATATGESRIVLVTGDAGIGKTRLVREAVEHARTQGVLAASGNCVQLGDVSIAFAPLVEAMRSLRDQLGDSEIDELLGPARPQLSPLLSGDDAALGLTSGIFDHLLAFLTRLGARQPVLLVLEDLHWADASTRDLVAYLGRKLRTAAVTLVLTLRADELHRRHPMRPVVAGLERDHRIERLDLGGLGRPDVARLLVEIGVDGPQGPTIDALYARSGGNPFYVEELVASGRLGGGVPETLSEVILSRIDLLSDDARRMLGAAAVIDDHVDDELLAAVTGESLDRVTSALREAVTEQVLVLDATTCRFRHALVREALYDDLLPGERTRLHIATASVLETVEHLAPHTRWAMVAHHWDAGCDATRAYVASVRAGLEAEKVHALADAAEQYERALGLRDRVDDPDQAVGLTAAELLMRAADAIQASSRSCRALVLREEALRLLGDTAPPEQRALVHERLARTHWTLHHGPAAVAAYEMAVALVAERPPSREKAFVLATLGQSLMVRAYLQQAIPLLRQAIQVAVEVGADDVEGHARCSLGPCLHGNGWVDEGFAELVRAQELSLAVGFDENVSRTYTNLAHACYRTGRYDDAMRVAREGFEWVIKVGHTQHHGEAIAGNVIAALHCAGRWADAEAIHNDPRIPTGDPYQELRWLPVLIDSGRLKEARAGVQDALDSTAEADDLQFGALAFLVAAQLELAEGDCDAARRYIADALPLVERTDDHFYLAQAYALGLTIEAARVEAARVDAPDGRHDNTEPAQARAVADDLHQRMGAAVVRLADLGVRLLPEAAAWIATGNAEHARVHGRDEAADWAAAAQAWADAGQPVRRAAAKARHAAALARTEGNRAEATDGLREALAVAERAGAEPLASQVRVLARRARLAIHPTGSGPCSPLNVTPRELDVLRLVALGRTNRQIGETLCISDKTASVHITNLLRKLGVGSRVEAAAIAIRSGLADAAGDATGDAAG